MGATAPAGQNANLESRVQSALKVLESIGGSAEIVKQEDKFMIQASGCPLAAAVNIHPEVCQLAESLVAEIVKAPVHELCDRTGRPKCRFEISQKKAQKGT